MSSLVHAPPLPSSKLDLLLEIHRRRAQNIETAKEMTEKERSMLREGTRKRRANTLILEEALMIVGADR
jgi:hypothetical protein